MTTQQLEGLRLLYKQIVSTGDPNTSLGYSEEYFIEKIEGPISSLTFAENN